MIVHLSSSIGLEKGALLRRGALFYCHCMSKYFIKKIVILTFFLVVYIYNKKSFEKSWFGCMIDMMISSQNPNIYLRGDKTMIVMDLKIDNFCALKNFHINMSYPKKIINSMIEGEFLKGRENFRYKKVNILMGSNATGKTSIGQMLMAIFNFIERKEAVRLKEKVNDKSKEAYFSMDFVVHSYKLYRINVKIVPFKNKEGDGEVKVCTRYVDINKKDSYETCAKK